MLRDNSLETHYMETFGQSEDPPGHSRSSIAINCLAGAIVGITLFVPLYLTVEFSRVETTQILPAKTAQNTKTAHKMME